MFVFLYFVFFYSANSDSLFREWLFVGFQASTSWNTETRCRLLVWGIKKAILYCPDYTLHHHHHHNVIQCRRISPRGPWCIVPLLFTWGMEKDGGRTPIAHLLLLLLQGLIFRHRNLQPETLCLP